MLLTTVAQTPLIIAVTCRNLPSAMLLLQNGANLYVENNDGYSAYDMCIRCLVNPVMAVVEAENCRRRNEAFAMASHSHLGAGSEASVLDEELIRMIIKEENK